MRRAISDCNITLNLAISPSTWLLGSNMVILKESIPASVQQRLAASVWEGHTVLDLVYIGTGTCRDLEDRKREHVINPKSTVYKHKTAGPMISLVVECPSKDKRALENIEAKYIQPITRENSVNIF